MTEHLQRKDYTEMPWANGLGSTVEMRRENSPQGSLLWRFSMATVSENGPFSLFPEIERNLTVIDGPGFDLVGDEVLRADLLCPVAFSGDIPIAARNVDLVSVDFNVMTHRTLPKPHVSVATGGTLAPHAGAILCIFALGKAQFAGRDLAHHDLLIDAPAGALSGAPCIAIQLFTNPLA